MDKNTNFDLAIIDADSIMYVLAYTRKELHEAKKALDASTNDIITEMEVPEAVCFVKSQWDENWRVLYAPDYMAVS